MMDLQLLAQQAKIFGTEIEIVTDDDVAELEQHLKNAGIQTVVHDGSGSKEDYASYDVSLLVNMERQYYPNEYNKTMLIFDKESERNVHHLGTKDKWLWNGSDFIQNDNPHLGMSPLGQDHMANDWENVVKSSFTPLLDAVLKRKLFPIYAGPISEWAIDQLAVTDLVEFIKKKIYNGVEYFAFDDKDEAMYWSRIYTCHSIVKRVKKIIPGFNNRFLFLTGALNGREIYSNWCKQHGLEEELYIVPCARFESVSKNMMFDGGLVKNYAEMDKEIYTGKRDKKYLCYNRMPRLHRVKVITELHKANLIEQGHVSFYNTDNHLVRWWERDSLDLSEEWTETFDYFWKNIVVELDYQLNKTVERWNPADLQRDDMIHFDTSYFSIVNETLFYKDTYRYKNIIDIQPTNSIFLSEKIYKPLCMKHPFVVVGVDGTLQALRQFGYQTFDKWIDESYDLEPDCDKRMTMVMEESKRLINLSHDEWQSMIKEMVPTLQHNFDVLCRNKDLIAAPINLYRLFMNDNTY